MSAKNLPLNQKKLAEAAALEREKLAAEREQRDLETKKLADAAALEREKSEHEATEAAAQRQHEIEIKRMEREQRVAQLAEERDRNDSVAARLKRYGDAMRNAITRQGSDPIETVGYIILNSGGATGFASRSHSSIFERQS